MASATTQKRKEEQRTLGDRMRHRRLMLEVREQAAEFAHGVKRNADPAEAVQFVLDQMLSAYEYSTEQVMSLPEDEYFQETLGGKVIHPWLREQERLGLQIVHTAGKAASMGLAERQVWLQEQQGALFAAVAEAVLREMGMGSDLRQQAHTLIAERLAAQTEVINGTARDRPAELPSRAAA